MKKLSRNEMKNVFGGYVSSVAGICGDYEGQTTYRCGWQITDGVCYVDICFCANSAPIPGGCMVRSEDMSDCR